MLHGKSARNPLGWTKQELRATILQLKRDFPEMPGIGYYGSDPGGPGCPGPPCQVRLPPLEARLPVLGQRDAGADPVCESALTRTVPGPPSRARAAKRQDGRRNSVTTAARARWFKQSLVTTAARARWFKEQQHDSDQQQRGLLQLVLLHWPRAVCFTGEGIHEPRHEWQSHIPAAKL